jgi:protein-L-isoaspartate(D-aspartate) O-methyltransferase
MLESLRHLGTTDESILTAMSNVQRHRFVDHFWWAPPTEGWSREKALSFDATDGLSDQALRAIYDPVSALLTRFPSGQTKVTSTLSAPIIVASMLKEMHLEPGLRVLEIGTGSGYNAALLAELVGDPSLVTSIDLDPGLTDEATARLEGMGCGRLVVRCGDGADGVADRAPFDRIVATVGCSDISPAWLKQMELHGELLVPLEHGAMHPRVRIRSSAQGIHGRFVGRSAFVRMQGAQADRRVWTGDMAYPAEPILTPLPSSVAEAFAGDASDLGTKRRFWDFSTYLSIRERRAVSGLGLGDGASIAYMREDVVGRAGPDGPELASRLLALAHDWIELGCPGIECYDMRFVPLAGEPTGPTPTDSLHGPWAIDRIDYRQDIGLLP